jgi:hypothetical protein
MITTRALARVHLDGIDLTIVALTLATAAIHIIRALANPRITALFTLNATGYAILLGLLYLPMPLPPQARVAARWTLVGYAAVTFVLYFVWGVMKAEWVVPIGPADKAVEALLIALVLLQTRQTRSVQARNQQQISASGR